MSVLLYAVHKIPGVTNNFKHFCANAEPNTEHEQSMEYLCRTFVFLFGR